VIETVYLGRWRTSNANRKSRTMRRKGEGGEEIEVEEMEVKER